jgi:hypothetical protein
MGEMLSPVAPRFNRALLILIVAPHEVLENSGIVGWMTDRLTDLRRPQDVSMNWPRCYAPRSCWPPRAGAIMTMPMRCGTTRPSGWR